MHSFENVFEEVPTEFIELRAVVDPIDVRHSDGDGTIVCVEMKLW